MGAIPAELLDQLVAESTKASGVPLYVEDPEVLAHVASLLRQGGGEHK